jgi:hypothetical protein
MQPEQVNLSKYPDGKNLPFFYEYAYHARCIKGGVAFDDWKIDYDDRQLFQEFLELTDVDGIRTSKADQNNWGSENQPVGLWHMLKHCDARQKLDFENIITIADISLLANMNERSVRNALYSEGENQLHSLENEAIDTKEALRWLRGRKTGFRETVFISFDADELPASLRYMELAPFIRTRLASIFDNDETFWIDEAAKYLKYSRDELLFILSDANNLPIKDIQHIAKAIKIDPVWLTEQVFTALFPEQMELILYKNQIDYIAESTNQQEDFIETVLTEKGIANGYIDISEKYSTFFPKDCFGERAKDKNGVPIELRFGNEVRNSDIRVKSSITISPRARFGSYFKTINAKAGDKIKIIKIDERIFELKHNPS